MAINGTPTCNGHYGRAETWPFDFQELCTQPSLKRNSNGTYFFMALGPRSIPAGYLKLSDCVDIDTTTQELIWTYG